MVDFSLRGIDRMPGNKKNRLGEGKSPLELAMILERQE